SFAITYPINQPKATLPLFLIFAIALLFWTAFGPANRNNANGNSSGVTALLAIAREVQKNKDLCFILLDNSERNFLGARSFWRKHIHKANNCLFLNFDCVGDGEHMLFLP